LAKKLKKKIEELCGLAGLEYEDRRARAEEILASNEWKQDICNDLLGLSFKDLERTLQGIIDERELRQSHEDEKLRIYKGNRSSKKSDSEKRHGHKPTHAPNKCPPRSLEQILARVYGPRVTSQEWSSEEVQQLYELKGMATRTGVFPVSDNDDSEVGE